MSASVTRKCRWRRIGRRPTVRRTRADQSGNPGSIPGIDWAQGEVFLVVLGIVDGSPGRPPMPMLTGCPNARLPGRRPSAGTRSCRAPGGHAVLSASPTSARPPGATGSAGAFAAYAASQPSRVTRLAGQSLALAAALSTALKFRGSFSVQAKGDGPVSMLLADCTDTGALRVTPAPGSRSWRRCWTRSHLRRLPSFWARDTWRLLSTKGRSKTVTRVLSPSRGAAWPRWHCTTS